MKEQGGGVKDRSRGDQGALARVEKGKGAEQKGAGATTVLATSRSRELLKGSQETAMRSKKKRGGHRFRASHVKME